MFQTVGELLSAIECAINDAEVYITGRGTLSDESWQVTIPDLVEKLSSDNKIEDIWDEKTIERIEKLNPEIQEAAIDFILDAQSKGINLRITNGYRSFEEQNELYAQGRTKPGEIVTRAKGGESYHNYGLAFDVVEIKDGKAIWDTDWEKIAEIGKEHGFEWGGDWTKFIDKPHFQMTFGYSTKQLYEMYDNENTDNENENKN